MRVECIEHHAEHRLLRQPRTLDAGEHRRFELAALEHGLYAPPQLRQLFGVGAQLLHQRVHFVACGAMDVETLQIAGFHHVAFQSLKILGDLVTLAGFEGLLGVLRPLPRSVGHAAGRVGAGAFRKMGQIGHSGVHGVSILVDQPAGGLLVALGPGARPGAVETLGCIGRDRGGRAGETAWVDRGSPWPAPSRHRPQTPFSSQ